MILQLFKFERDLLWIHGFDCFKFLIVDSKVRPMKSIEKKKPKTLCFKLVQCGMGKIVQTPRFVVLSQFMVDLSRTEILWCEIQFLIF